MLSIEVPMRWLALLLFLPLVASPSPCQVIRSGFAPFDLWSAAVLAGDSAALTALYANPSPRITNLTGKKEISFPDELSFWSSWKSKGLTDISANLVREDDPQPRVHVLALELTLTLKDSSKESPATHKEYVSLVQAWVQQGNDWRLSVVQRTAAGRLRQPLNDKEIYPVSADATAEIADTVRDASASHKRILLVFGGNWCFDCHVLDEAFHSPEIAPTLDKSFLVVHIDIGEMNKNLDVAKKYDIPLDRGVPAIAVLDAEGKLLFSQKHGEFEAARSMAPEDILAFLHAWQPGI
jgi:thioredoxin 1